MNGCLYLGRETKKEIRDKGIESQRKKAPCFLVSSLRQDCSDPIQKPGVHRCLNFVLKHTHTHTKKETTETWCGTIIVRNRGYMYGFEIMNCRWKQRRRNNAGTDRGSIGSCSFF